MARPWLKKTVYFEVSSPGGAVVGGGTAITNDSGMAQAEAITLPSGDVGSGYTITAYFGSASTPLPAPAGSYNAADPDYQAAASQAAPVTVDDATTTSLVAEPSPAGFARPVTLVATVSPSGTLPSASWPVGASTTTPSGEIMFSDGSNILGSAPITLSSSGISSASFSVKGLDGGTHSLSATYSGNAHLNPSTGQASLVVVFTETVSGRHIGPLVIEDGQDALVTGKVLGPVVVERGGGLEVDGGSVTGPIWSTGAAGFALCGATVRGPVVVGESTGFVLIGGGRGLGCNATSVFGPVVLAGNTGGVEVAGNDIAGPLFCAGNAPLPTDNGEPNSARVATGQCEGLATATTTWFAPELMAGPRSWLGRAWD